MYDRPVPAGLGSIEEWILQHLYDHPNDKHSPPLGTTRPSVEGRTVTV